MYTLKEKNIDKMQTLKDLNDLRLYLITDKSLFKEQIYFLTAVEAALMGGVKALQLREKDLSDSELIKLGIQLSAGAFDIKAYKCCTIKMIYQFF